MKSIFYFLCGLSVILLILVTVGGLYGDSGVCVCVCVFMHNILASSPHLS